MPYYSSLLHVGMYHLTSPPNSLNHVIDQTYPILNYEQNQMYEATCTLTFSTKHPQLRNQSTESCCNIMAAVYKMTAFIRDGCFTGLVSLLTPGDQLT